MRVEFHAEKDATNRSKHGISLRRAKSFDFDAALYIVDDSQDYGEVRLIAIGFLDAAVHVLVFTPMDETAIRAITLRKASKQDARRYAEEDSK